MPVKDYYQTLGISRGASEKEIRQAYRRLARKHHPDVNPSDKAAESKFKEISEAYEVLNDSEKRAKYDRYGDAWQHVGTGAPGAGFQGQPGGFGTGGAGGPGFEGFHFETGGPTVGEDVDLGGLFERFFGGGVRAGRTGTRQQARRARRGEDVEQPVEVTLDEAYRGATRLLQVATADGSSTKRLEVKIPPGVQNGSRIRVQGAGGPGLGGGANGDLFLVLSVQPHASFERKGDDLHTEVAVPLTTAVLGGEVQVPTLKGSKVALKIAAETQNARVIRLAGLGMPKLHGDGKGDLYAKVRVVLPTALSANERQLFEELAKLRPA